MNSTELVDRYCQAWSEPDAARRSGLLRSVWGAGATYTDPLVHAEGAEELLAHIAKVQLSRPGARVVRTTVVDSHHGHARFGFHVVMPHGAIIREGIDIALISPDGKRIERIVGFFGPLEAD
jgi:hypothetical protein